MEGIGGRKREESSYVCTCVCLMRQSEGKHGCCSLSDIHLVTLFLETGLSSAWYSPRSLGQLTVTPASTSQT